ncbi:MAG TPA: NUDIX domain-containing protein [Candidatus Acidoferrum sp.]|nr:NUDIX domain-containing protein [Candidatus Acidoferrum sp.]
MTSWIQNHVLLELTRHSTRRYSQLRPRDIEGNLFLYHLGGLIKEGLVEKADNHYRLSVKGMRFAGTLSLETGKTRLQPKILTTVSCKNEQGEHLLVRWHRQPNIDLISFPHGMMHFGETAADMAATELAEKAGLVAELTFLGSASVRGWHEGVIDRHMLVHIFEGHNFQPGRQEELRPEVCESFWAKLDTIKPEQFVPGFYEIAQLSADPDMPRLTEISVELERLDSALIAKRVKESE